MSTMNLEVVLETDVRLAMDGDAEAYGRLIEKSANVVCSIALAIVRNVQASEDIAPTSTAWRDRWSVRSSRGWC